MSKTVAYGVIILIIKQNLRLGEDLQDIIAKVMVSLLALFGEIERDFISLRTKEALAAKKAQGIIFV